MTEAEAAPAPCALLLRAASASLVQSPSRCPWDGQGTAIPSIRR